MAEALMKLDIPQDAVRAVVAAEVAKAIAGDEDVPQPWVEGAR